MSPEITADVNVAAFHPVVAFAELVQLANPLGGEPKNTISLLLFRHPLCLEKWIPILGDSKKAWGDRDRLCSVPS